VRAKVTAPAGTIQDGSIRPQHQQRDGELIELHGAIVGGLTERLAITAASG
jgi:hypothetical protein